MSFAAIVILFLLGLAGCRTTGPVPYTQYGTVIRGTYHYVKSGETLWSISRLYDIDLQSIIKANHITDVTTIERGQRILIPGASGMKEKEVPVIFRDSFVWPVKGNILSYFGSKMDRTNNKGIDIRAREGESVRAARGGKVVFCDEWLKGFGKTVILDHGDNFQTVYAYNSAILVNLGDAVERNTAIASVGRSGRANEPSVHFEIRKNGEAQNPLYYLPH